MMELKAFFDENPRAALAFSGGADSAYLLYAAVKSGADIKAYYLSSEFQPEFERLDAKRLADELAVPMEIIDFDILSVPGVAENPPDRCCLCKRAMFSRMKKLAQSDGYTLLIDGTNASDNAEERPGMIALRELGVRSPLRECGLTKAQVRSLSKRAGLFTWDKPSYSCLATRVSGELTAGELCVVERAENAIRALGFEDFRVRVTGDAAKLQFTARQWSIAAGMREKLLNELSPLFRSVTLDMEPREESE